MFTPRIFFFGAGLFMFLDGTSPHVEFVIGQSEALLRGLLHDFILVGGEFLNCLISRGCFVGSDFSVTRI